MNTPAGVYYVDNATYYVDTEGKYFREDGQEGVFEDVLRSYWAREEL